MALRDGCSSLWLPASKTARATMNARLLGRHALCSFGVDGRNFGTYSGLQQVFGNSSSFSSLLSPDSTLLSRPRHALGALRTCSGAQDTTKTNARRYYSSSDYSSFTEKLEDPTNKLQSYISTSRDPYLNLSIEDHILRKSPADSTVLFLYVNRPCVVIGRNQNPWTEVNLGILNAARGTHETKDTEPPGIGTVDLVRRRSGGGTVFHDEGNLNWSITCPRGDFTRDLHAEMVVRALRSLGIDRARVNERHDIVLDQGSEKRLSKPQDTHRTSYTVEEGKLPRALKVSGSAYKLTRLRALHHATTLLSSPNLHIIPHYLRSPAKDVIQAQGVESVSSPVANIGLDVKTFQRHLQAEFAAMYAEVGTPSIVQTVGEDYLNIPDIRKGYDELQTDEWMWSQTPAFRLVLNSKNDIGIAVKVHHGVIKSLEFENSEIADMSRMALRTALVGLKIQDIKNWTRFLQKRVRSWDHGLAKVAGRLDELLPIPEISGS
ncbi:LplA Lipoate-protein ligase A [Pyrenophora tritici-repentis]|uniref:Putative lipoate-protein ligase A n=2 Tax=Pyrenophora tritici-repentis TaxID=45151 RepID=A0A2W1H565_9PLEO|nr:lipoate-protein ligase A [Pyrenophora tritici-repentis Pt-1C-BFP]KAA8619675.1 lipoate-protein ligase A [Pyrenophora tritici-repentis]EDU47075.1 lipoate-protein ligase A [Pyrenophora tritici-repentis Pt-1C-BFP]KAF7447815.1 lipoate-protein ligase A [Pyrenophora tritici-repentis]KAF7571518.1 LplA, Lipoate-protein ligase A [Pyrenophora tritici-repentis]KAG9385258.1 lipoate-protein ligase A [Pyrenophora tritici-repentis]